MLLVSSNLLTEDEWVFKSLRIGRCGNLLHVILFSSAKVIPYSEFATFSSYRVCIGLFPSQIIWVNYVLTLIFVIFIDGCQIFQTLIVKKLNILVAWPSYMSKLVYKICILIFIAILKSLIFFCWAMQGSGDKDVFDLWLRTSSIRH